MSEPHQALKHQLQAVAESLRSAKSFLLQHPQRIPGQWVAVAIKGAQNGSQYMRDLVHDPELTSQFDNPARLQPLCDEVAHELETFEKFLKEDILPSVEGSFACGEHYFNLLLNDWHHLSINADQLYLFAERLFKQTQQQLEALCKTSQALMILTSSWQKYTSSTPWICNQWIYRMKTGMSS